MRRRGWRADPNVAVDADDHGHGALQSGHGHLSREPGAVRSRKDRPEATYRQRVEVRLEAAHQRRRYAHKGAFRQLAILEAARVQRICAILIDALNLREKSMSAG